MEQKRLVTDTVDFVNNFVTVDVTICMKGIIVEIIGIELEWKNKISK